MRPLRPKSKVSLPVASSAPARVRDELLFNFECPARAPCRPSSPAAQATTADADEIGSLSLKWKNTSARKSRMLRGVGQGRVVTACAKKRPTARRKDQFARSDKSHIVRHKIGRWGKATGGPGTGDPARPRAGHFMIAQCVLILRARELRPRRRAPVRPTPQMWKRWAREWKKFAASRGARRRRWRAA